MVRMAGVSCIVRQTTLSSALPDGGPAELYGITGPARACASGALAVPGGAGAAQQDREITFGEPEFIRLSFFRGGFAAVDPPRPNDRTGMPLARGARPVVQVDETGRFAVASGQPSAGDMPYRRHAAAGGKGLADLSASAAPTDAAWP